MTNKPESQIQREVMLMASKCGVILWRNHTAAIEDKNGRWHRMGLCKGSSDLIGIHKASGRLVAAEIKTPIGRVSKEQQNFIDKINEYGGIAFVCRDAKEFKNLLDNCLQV